MMVHTLAAAYLKLPELAIDQQEAEMLAKAAVAVMAEYDAVMEKMSPKVAAWIGLGQACSVVYGPRAFVIWQKAKAPQEAKNGNQ